MGPFLRINSLNSKIIKNQLFHFAKESLRQIVLHSKCGICTSTKELKIKNIPNIDINIFKENSPLLCIYKKANPKVEGEKNRISWDEGSFKKEITVSSNAFMTLCILDLIDHYKKFQSIDRSLYALTYVYGNLAKLQLDFYSSYMRSEEGVFVDKINVSEDSTRDIKFEVKKNKFKFSDQALMMAAYYKFSTLSDNKDSEAYRVFSQDILNMFLTYREELYELSLEENIKLCFALNLFYKYSNMEEAKALLLDLMDYMVARLESEENLKIEYQSLILINIYLFNKYTGMMMFSKKGDKINEYLLSLYSPEQGIFLKNSDKKEIDFSSSEIFFYLLSTLYYNEGNEELNSLGDIYKRQVIHSGIVSSWPDAPNLDNPERYDNYTLKSEDLIDELQFRLPSIATPESTNVSPVIYKSIKYSLKKQVFDQSKNSFYSEKNLNILYMILHLYLN